MDELGDPDWGLLANRMAICLELRRSVGSATSKTPRSKKEPHRKAPARVSQVRNGAEVYTGSRGREGSYPTESKISAGRDIFRAGWVEVLVGQR